MADITKELATLSAAVVPGAPIFASIACANFVAKHDIAGLIEEMAEVLEFYYDYRCRAILTKLGGEHG